MWSAKLQIQTIDERGITHGRWDVSIWISALLMLWMTLTLRVDAQMDETSAVIYIADEGRSTSANLLHVPKPQLNKRWTNGLGMIFIPIPETEVLMCLWETRVRDFEVFTKNTSYDASRDVFSPGPDGWKRRGVNWKKPGFDQTTNSPVCGLSWDDCKTFCRWLTQKERAEGALGPQQRYRMPTDREWSWAVGLPEEDGETPATRDQKLKGIYPWGPKWPPPQGVANYGGQECMLLGKKLRNYSDGWLGTAPVGSFPVNRYGLYDLGGNVWEWCEDWFDASEMYRTMRGGSFCTVSPALMESGAREKAPPGLRNINFGFRCVLTFRPDGKKKWWDLRNDPVPSR